MGTIIAEIKGDARSLDYGLHNALVAAVPVSQLTTPILRILPRWKQDSFPARLEAVYVKGNLTFGHLEFAHARLFPEP